MIPAWLYLKREDRYGGRIYRFGSRKPLRVCLTVMSDPYMATCYMLALGKLGLQFGPAEGIVEGHAGMPPGSRSTLVREFSDGRGVGVSWDGAW